MERLKPNQIHHRENKKILHGRHDGKYYQEGKPRINPLAMPSVGTIYFNGEPRKEK